MFTANRSGKRGWPTSRRLGVLLVSCAAFLTVHLAGPAQASASTEAYRFIPIRVVCHDYEDYWPDWRDETVLYYGGIEFFDYYPDEHVSYPPATTFTGSTFAIDMYELDGDWRNHNNLGRVVVSATDLGLERSQSFKGNGWDYELVYRIERA